MKIDKITCRVVRVPFNYPLWKETQYAVCDFVEIETDEGLKGHVMSEYPMPFGIREFINRDVAPTITGMDPMRIEDVHTAISLKFGTKHFMGAYASSLSLIDIALWDIKGKATGQPVWKLLGGAHNRVPVYITFGLAQYTQEELVEVAKILVADGQNRLKMVVAAGPKPDDDPFVSSRLTDDDVLYDAERIRAVREAVGDKVELMIDANQNAPFTYAYRLAKLAEPLNLTWFEDPVYQADPRLMARLRKEVTTPIAAGSSGTSNLLRFREFLLNEAVDIAQPNVRDIGGYTVALKAAALAQSFNIQLHMGGAWPHWNIHLHAGVPNGGKVEFHWRSWKAFEAAFDGGPTPVNGWASPPEAPGTGFAPKDGMVDEFEVH